MIPVLDLAGSLLGANSGTGGNVWWNSSDKTTNITLSNSDLTAEANTSNYEIVRSAQNTFNPGNGGKYYIEIEIDISTAGDIHLGFIRSAQAIVSGTNIFGTSCALWRNTGAITANGWVDHGTASAYTAGDRLGFAIDVGNGKLFLRLNGTWQNSADPVAGTNPSFDTMPNDDFAVVFHTDNNAGNDQVTIMRPIDHADSAPSGFTAI